VAAGILAPLLAKGVIVLPGDEGGAAAERGTYAVSSESVESIPEANRIDLDAVSLR